MTVNAIPKRVFSSELPSGYRCPIDEISESSEATTEWVQCPLVSWEYISLGSCLDLQGLARADEFYSDPYIDMFEALAIKYEVSIGSVRRICLRHQADVLMEMVSEPNEDERQIKLTLSQVYSKLAEESNN